MLHGRLLALPLAHALHPLPYVARPSQQGLLQLLLPLLWLQQLLLPLLLLLVVLGVGLRELLVPSEVIDRHG